MEKRHAALLALQWLEQQMIREHGGNNRGAWVEAIQRSDTLTTPDTGYPWCMSTQQAAWRLGTGGLVEWKTQTGRKAQRSYQDGPPPRQGAVPWRIVGGELLAGGTASVAVFLGWAREHGYVTPRQRPFAGDHVCYGPDHVGMVEKVTALGPVWRITTLEGNTSAAGAVVSDAGSSTDGLYRKKRVIVFGRTVAVRVPGRVAA